MITVLVIDWVYLSKIWPKSRRDREGPIKHNNIITNKLIFISKYVRFRSRRCCSVVGSTYHIWTTPPLSHTSNKRKRYQHNLHIHRNQGGAQKKPKTSCSRESIADKWMFSKWIKKHCVFNEFRAFFCLFISLIYEKVLLSNWYLKMNLILRYFHNLFSKCPQVL